MTIKRIILGFVLIVAGMGIVHAQIGATVVPGNSLAESLAWLQSSAQSNGNYIIEVMKDERIGEQRLIYNERNNITITLRGIGANRTISLASPGHLFGLHREVTLVLDNNITLKGLNNNDSSLIVVGGKLIMNDGAAVVGNSTDDTGGGVNMIGGSFTMNGGMISGNSAALGGGVYVSGGIFTMNGGTISGNSSSGGGGVYVIGVPRPGGIFTMNGGNISGNNSGGSGGGVFVETEGDFTMSGGMISGNRADSIGGGGVTVRGGTFTMSNGEISGNIANFGGGVHVQDGFRNKGSFIMSGGMISGNSARQNGGGVFVEASGTFTKTGSGTITGYASDTVNGNVVKDKNVVQSNTGYAVYVRSSPVKRRETTAGVGVNMDSSVSGAAGGWEN